MAVLRERGFVGTVAGTAADMGPVARDHTAGKEAVVDTAVGIAAGIAADRPGSHIRAEYGNAAAIVWP